MVLPKTATPAWHCLAQGATANPLPAASCLSSFAPMSKVQAIESELQKLTPAEIREVREWLENFMEDQLQFADEFEADIQQSERDLAAGVSSRTRQPDAD
jgi:hypothetical protein